MLAVLIAFVSAVLLSWHFAITQPAEIEFRNLTSGDVAAANFWSYQKSLSNYLYANPGASGTVADSSLVFEQGYVRNPAWTNVVQGGKLYTYSNAAIPQTTIDAIADRGGRSMVIGLAQTGGTMTSLTGAASGFTLPAAIPAGAIVVIGK